MSDNQTTGNKNSLITWISVIGLLATTLTGVFKCTDSGKEFWDKFAGNSEKKVQSNSVEKNTAATANNLFWLDGRWLGKLQDNHSSAELPYPMELTVNWDKQELLTNYASQNCHGTLQIMHSSEGLVECLEKISDNTCEDSCEIKIERLSNDVIEITYSKNNVGIGLRPVAQGNLMRQKK